MHHNAIWGLNAKEPQYTLLWGDIFAGSEDGRNSNGRWKILLEDVTLDAQVLQITFILQRRKQI